LVFEEFRSAMRDQGLSCDETIVADGKLHRFYPDGDHKNNGWYFLYGPPFEGRFGCWKRGINEVWVAGDFENYSQDELDELYRLRRKARAEQEREKADRNEKARNHAIWKVGRSQPVISHPYLTNKGVQLHGNLRQLGDDLILPLTDANGELHSIQIITPEGDKTFPYGSRISGCFFVLADQPDKPLVIVEGYSTGATIHEATDYAVACALYCGNLPTVAKALREKFPTRSIILAADNDRWNEKNSGLTKATEAASEINARLAIPIFKHIAARPTDFNDLGRLEGLDTVKSQIEYCS